MRPFLLFLVLQVHLGLGFFQGGGVRNTFFVCFVFFKEVDLEENVSDIFHSSEHPFKHHFASMAKQKSFQPNS